MDLSIIVVNHNTRQLLVDCLNSVYDTLAGLPFELVVVDNGSSDGSQQAVRERFPEAILIESPVNLGFARANNLAIKRARGRYFLLLNSDAVVEPGAVKALIDFMEAVAEAGLAGGQLLNKDGSRQNSFSNFPTFATELLNKGLLRLLFPRSYPSKRQDFLLPVRVDAVIGAFFVARREAVKQVGLMDEDYFLFLEETDWSLRMRKAGWGVYFVPGARACHFQGGTVGKNRIRARIEFYRSRYLYFQKHQGNLAAGTLKLALFFRLLLNSCLLTLALAFTLGLSPSVRSRLAVNLGLLWWHLRLCPENNGLNR